MSPLDAELNLLFGDALSSNKKKRTITVVDTDPDPVADRVRFFDSTASIITLTPEQVCSSS
jgi:hypothetical protein